MPFFMRKLYKKVEFCQKKSIMVEKGRRWYNLGGDSDE